MTADALPGLGYVNENDPSGIATLGEGALRALFARLGAEGSTRSQLWMGRVANKLSLDQACDLLQTLSADTKGLAAIQQALALRIASLDARRGMELSIQLNNFPLICASIVCLARADGAEALRAIARIPDSTADFLIRSGLGADEMEALKRQMSLAVGGSFSAMAGVFREHPSLFKHPLAVSLLATSLAQSSLARPEEALEKIRSYCPELQESNSPPGWSLNLIRALWREWSHNAPEVASAFLQSLPDAEKPFRSTYDETLYRYKKGGLEDALQFAEGQKQEDLLSEAAEAVWGELAQRDPRAAMEWVAALPEGAFKRGVVGAVCQEQFRHAETFFPEPREILEAMQKIPVQSLKIEGIATVLLEMNRLKNCQASSAELLEGLSLSPEEKALLLRRIAPMRNPESPTP